MVHKKPAHQPTQRMERHLRRPASARLTAMLLAVDIGNTNIKFGVFDGDKLLSKFSIPTSGELSASKLKSHLADDNPITNSVVCSVVSEKDKALSDALSQAFGIDALVITNDIDFGFKI